MNIKDSHPWKDHQVVLKGLKEYRWMLLEQIAFAACVALVWRLTIWQFGLQYHKEDAEIFIVGVFFIAGAAWVLKGQKAFDVVFDGGKLVSSAVKRGKKKAFMEEREEHLPLVVHTMLFVFACVADGVVCFFPYASAIDGACAVFFVTLIFRLFWAVIIFMDDPTRFPWIRSQIMQNDPSWLEEDVEAYFAKHREQRKAKKARQQRSKLQPSTADGALVNGQKQ